MHVNKKPFVCEALSVQNALVAAACKEDSDRKTITHTLISFVQNDEVVVAISLTEEQTKQLLLKIEAITRMAQQYNAAQTETLN